jgi:hypothetical protein
MKKNNQELPKLTYLDKRVFKIIEIFGIKNFNLKVRVLNPTKFLSYKTVLKNI